jgi:hypothetical protein
LATSDQRPQLVTIAATAATTAATAAIPAATATTTTAAAALHLGTGFVDVQGAATYLSSVQGGDRFVSLFPVRHLHETKAARAAGVAIGHDADAVNLSMRLEHLSQFFLGRIEVKVPNENILQASRL